MTLCKDKIDIPNSPLVGKTFHVTLSAEYSTPPSACREFNLTITKHYDGFEYEPEEDGFKPIGLFIEGTDEQGIFHQLNTAGLRLEAA